MKLPGNLRLELANYAYLSLGVSLLTLIAAVLLQRFLPPRIPLFYGQPEGEGELASSLALVLPSALSLLILVINCGLSFLVKDDFLKKTLVLTTLVASIFAAIATVKIILLVGYL